MNDFRGPLPLNDRDFAEVRRNVLAKIEKRPPVIGWMLAAAAAIALVFILVPREHVRTPSHRLQARKAVQPPPVVAPPQLAPVQIAEPVKKPKHKPEPQPQLVADKGAPPSDEEIRMNIQTADPNVRIIWIARR
jgi:hypothetical protein